MSDERQQQENRELEKLGIDFEASQDQSDIRAPCDLTDECEASRENSLVLDALERTFQCTTCGERGSFTDLIKLKQERRDHAPAAPPLESEYLGVAESNDVPDDVIDVPSRTALVRVERNLAPAREPKVKHLREADRMDVRFPPPKPKEKKPFNGEKFIVTLLALVFLVAGLGAAALSGYANFQAFSGSVADALQARVWGWTGVIAAIISFGGFTFFYWHTANHRMKEGWRALLFALAGMGTSIVGTESYISANNQQAAAEISRADTNRGILETQIADWRRQLEGIPPETRSVEGLESYLAEVERVGRTEQKPYRDAQNELGLARRRDELQGKIEAANAELLGLGTGNILTEAQSRTRLPSWFFALMLELFSSQGTSIALVALLILYGRRPAAAATS